MISQRVALILDLDPTTPIKAAITKLETDIKKKKDEREKRKSSLKTILELYISKANTDFPLCQPLIEGMKQEIQALSNKITALESILSELQQASTVKAAESNKASKKNTSYQPTFFTDIADDDNDRLGQAIAKATAEREKASEAVYCHIL